MTSIALRSAARKMAAVIFAELRKPEPDRGIADAAFDLLTDVEKIAIGHATAEAYYIAILAEIVKLSKRERVH